MEEILCTFFHRITWILLGYSAFVIGATRIVIPNREGPLGFLTVIWGKILFALIILIPMAGLIHFWGFWPMIYWTLSVGLSLSLVICVFFASILLAEKWPYHMRGLCFRHGVTLTRLSMLAVFLASTFFMIWLSQLINVPCT